RINRIFEGTNEINRLLTVGTLLKRAMKGQLPLMAQAQKLQDEMLGFPGLEEEEDRPFAREEKIVKNLKKVALLTSGLAVQKYMMQIEEQQEILSHLSDIAMEAYAAESVLVRAKKLVQSQGEEKAANYVRIAQCYLNDSANRAEAHAKDILACISEGDVLRTNLAALRRFLKFTPINTIEIRQKLAETMLTANKYPF